ncbi:hypothetical protein [Mycobacteroides abscessus]
MPTGVVSTHRIDITFVFISKCHSRFVAWLAFALACDFFVAALHVAREAFG